MSKKQQIIEAAEALVAEGINPTMEKIRERMGGGSFATISPVLRAWKAEYQAEVVQTQEAPPEAIDAGTKAAAAIWVAAMQTTAARIKDTEHRADERVSNAEQERDEAMAEITRLEQETQDIKATADQAVADLQAERQALSASRAAHAEAQTQASERAVRIESLTDEIKHVRDSERRARDQVAEITAKLETQADKLETQAQALADAEGRAKTESLRADRAEALAQQAQEHAADLKGEIKTLRHEVKTIGGELAQAIANENAGEKTLEQALVQVRDAEDRERKVRDEAAELRGQLTALETPTENETLSTKSAATSRRRKSTDPDAEKGK